LEGRPEEHDAVRATSMSTPRSRLAYALGVLLTTAEIVGTLGSSRAMIVASDLNGKWPR
jgi:hypothetical protein